MGRATEDLEWVVAFPAVSDRPGDALAFRYEGVPGRDFSGSSWLAPYECKGEFGTVRSTTRAGADRVAAGILSKLSVLTPRGPPASSSATLLVQSVEGRPENPSFAGAEPFMGYKDGEAGYIDPAAQAFQATRMREENATAGEARLRREELASAVKGASKGSGG